VLRKVEITNLINHALKQNASQGMDQDNFDRILVDSSPPHLFFISASAHNEKEDSE
jgi:hypothetical protein